MEGLMAVGPIACRDLSCDGSCGLQSVHSYGDTAVRQLIPSDVAAREFAKTHHLDPDKVERCNSGAGQVSTAASADILEGLRYIADSPAREHGGFHPEVVRTAKAAIERVGELQEELQAVLDDWNSLVKASGSPTNGGAVGYVANLRRRVGELEKQLAQAQSEAKVGKAAAQLLVASDEARAKAEAQNRQFEDQLREAQEKAYAAGIAAGDERIAKQKAEQALRKIEALDDHRHDISLIRPDCASCIAKVAQSLDLGKDGL